MSSGMRVNLDLNPEACQGSNLFYQQREARTSLKKGFPVKGLAS